MNKIKYILFVLVFNFIAVQAGSGSEHSNAIERRMSVDVGSGSTKLAIADVDCKTQQIVQLLFEESIPVPYQKHLKSFDGTFDEEIQALGLEAFQKIGKLKEEYGVQKVKAIATEAFRNAVNSEEFVEEIADKTGFRLEVISQKQEGVLAFYSGVAASGASNPDELVIWDIGTGSLQIMTLNAEGKVVVFMQPLGSIPVRDYLIEVIQEREIDQTSTPNPLEEDQASAMDVYIRSIARKAYPIIKEKIASSDRRVYGIGRLFYHGVGPLMPNAQVVERKGLREFIDESLGKLDEDFENPEFANVDLSNCILVLGFMKALQIHEVSLIDTTTAKGMLSYPDYWD